MTDRDGQRVGGPVARGSRPTRRLGAVPTIVGACLLGSLGCASTSVPRPAWLGWRPLQDANSLTRQEMASSGLEAMPHSLAGRMRNLEQIAAQADSVSATEASRIASALAMELQAGPEPALQLALVRTLRRLRHPAALPGLTWALEQGDEDTRREACRAIAQLEDPEAIPILARAARSAADVDVRIAATEGLRRFRDPFAVQALGQALDDRDPAVQYTAMQSLEQLTGRDLGLDARQWKQLAQNPAELLGDSAGRWR